MKADLVGFSTAVVHVGPILELQVSLWIAETLCGWSSKFAEPQGVQIPLKTPSSSSCKPQPTPPCHGGWPSPARPSRMKFQPRPRFAALAVRGGRIFRSKWCFCWVFFVVFWGFGGPSRSLDPVKAFGGLWKLLEAQAWTAARPGASCNGLELRGNPHMHG